MIKRVWNIILLSAVLLSAVSCLEKEMVEMPVNESIILDLVPSATKAVADSETESMRRALQETERRRAIQMAYNEEHGIVPKTIIKSVRDLIEISSSTAERKGRTGVKMTKAEKEKEIARLEKQMKEAARMMEYEYAALLRDQIIELRGNGL